MAQIVHTTPVENLKNYENYPFPERPSPGKTVQFNPLGEESEKENLTKITSDYHHLPFAPTRTLIFFLFSLIWRDCHKMLPTPLPRTLHKFPLTDVSALPVPLFLLLQTTASTNQNASLIPWSWLTSRLCGKPKICFPQAIWLCMPELDLLFHTVTSIGLDRRI